MSITAVHCHYCSAENLLQTIERTTSDKATLKLYEYQVTDKVVIPEKNVDCPFCHRKYELIKFPDFNWVRRKLKPTNTMVETFKVKFANSTLDMLYGNIIGITRPQLGLGERVRRRRHYHVCFELEGTRAYVDCQEIEVNGTTILRGVDIYEA